MASHQKIAIIYSDFKNDFNDGYVLGIQKQANMLGYLTFTFSMPQMSELYTNQEEWVYTLIDFDKYDGIIFVARSFATHKNLIVSIEDALKKKCRCPIVVIGASDTFPHVLNLDYRSGFTQLATHLIETHDCRNICLLGGDRNIPDERIDCFKAVMAQHGLPCGENQLFYGGYWIQGAETLAKKIACGNMPKPDAVMCLNDEIAYALIKNLYSNGMSVPQDIIVTGYDNAAYASNPAVSITTFPADTKLCGEKAVAMLYTLMTGKEITVSEHTESAVITGESCGCGSKARKNVRNILDSLQKAETADMEFRNSEFEEKLYQVQTQKELSLFIKNHKYLMRDQISVGVNLMRPNDENAVCIFLKDYLLNGETASFPARDIFPMALFSFGSIKNVQVLPLVFHKEIYGFMTVGFAEESVCTFFTKMFAHRLAIGVELLNLRHSENMEFDEPEDEIIVPPLVVEKNKLSSLAVVVTRDGVTQKVNPERVYYFEAAEKRVFAVMREGKFEVRKRLFELEEMLENKPFYRASKSVLVNMEKVAGYQIEHDRSVSAVLADRTKIRISKKYISEFKRLFEARKSNNGNS